MTGVDSTTETRAGKPMGPPGMGQGGRPGLNDDDGPENETTVHDEKDG
jgi:hypothetical protein